MRDRKRIPVVLAAIEREWLKKPDQRLGQVLVNLLRINADVPREDEGARLFTIEDTRLLDWLNQDEH